MDPTYIPDLVPEPNAALQDLLGLNWERRPDAPRSEYFCSDFGKPYTYGRGRGRRTYRAQPWSPRILDIRAALEQHLGTKFEVCFLNLYLDQSDSLGWHADDSPEMDDARPVVSVSLGVAREIHIRPKVGPDEVAPPGETRRYLLASGSAFVMPPGFQDLYQHRIPRAGFQCGQRVSLTFRGWTPGIET